MAGGLPIRRAGQCCSSTRGRVTARPRAGLAERARETGIEAVILAPGQDLAALAHEAVAAGADALGMASGDGSLAVVAAVAAAHRRDRCTQPVGTRPDRNSPSSGKPAGTYRLKATVLSHLYQEGSPRIRPPSTAAAASALERFLQLTGDFVGRGLHGGFTTLAALVSALSSPFSMVGSPTAMSPAWLAVRSTTWGLPSSLSITAAQHQHGTGVVVMSAAGGARAPGRVSPLGGRARW